MNTTGVNEHKYPDVIGVGLYFTQDTGMLPQFFCKCRRDKKKVGIINT